MKKFLRTYLSALITASVLLTGAAQAHGYKKGDLVIAHPTATPSTFWSKNSAVYLVGLRNAGKEPEVLMGASTPVAQSVELHIMKMDGEVMRMREVTEIAIPPNVTIDMKPGAGYHLMLINLNKKLSEGDKFPLTLKFKNAGSVDIEVWVEKPKSSQDHSQHK
jgi:periplasmic copper chaperone A